MLNGCTMEAKYKDFKCEICYEIYLYPVSLPCNHRFCKLCLDKHLENNKMTCPLCRYRVSNWLRQLRRSNGDVVDKPFWDTLQKLFPKEIENRINGHVDYQSTLNSSLERVAKIDEKEKSRSASLHKALLDLRCLRDWDGDWHGWPDPVFQVCRNVLQNVSEHPINETPSTSEAPDRRLSKPGEIHQEYEQFLQQELEEKKREDEKNFRLSEAMIKMIEEDERREEEERIKQLLLDEELARRLNEEASPNSDGTINELPQDGTDMYPPSLSVGSSTPLHLSHPVMRLDIPSPSKEVHHHPRPPGCSNTSSPSTSRETRTQCSQSPIRLDTQSTSKENIFAKFWKESPSSSHSSSKSSPRQDTTSDSKMSSISNKELSHFTPVQPGPSGIKNESKNKKKKEVVPPSSRCSSGTDSIGQELNHFKPIRSSPTTPPKEGSRGLIPQVVVAQRGVGVPDLNILPLSPLDLLSADVSLDELETSINLEKQLEEDRKLAMEIQNELNREMKMPSKTDYNLRKRKRPSGNIKKKVLLDRNQATLDNLLIK